MTASKVVRRLASRLPRRLVGAVKVDYTVSIPSTASATVSSIASQAILVSTVKLTEAVQTKVTEVRGPYTVTVTYKEQPKTVQYQQEAQAAPRDEGARRPRVGQPSGSKANHISPWLLTCIAAISMAEVFRLPVPAV